MRSLSPLGIGLCVLFGCLLLGFIAELYYIFWWKKRFTNKGIEVPHPTNNGTELSSYLFCWKTPTSLFSSKRQELPTSVKPGDVMNGHELDLELGVNEKDLVLKSYGEESVESELMRLHNLCGPPRFLFTIMEETKEDLESDDGKSRGERSGRKGSRNKSLSEFLASVETPFMTPLASPNLKSQSLESYNHHGFNPLFESSTDAEINRLRFSPPPKFKFLRDAEEKLMRKLMEAAERKCQLNGDSMFNNIEEKDDAFVTVLVSQSKQREVHQQLPQYHCPASQVLPLATSPSAFKPLDNKSTLQ